VACFLAHSVWCELDAQASPLLLWRYTLAVVSFLSVSYLLYLALLVKSNRSSFYRASDVFFSFQSTNANSALEAVLALMRYINWHFTYLFTHFLLQMQCLVLAVAKVFACPSVHSSDTSCCLSKRCKTLVYCNSAPRICKALTWIQKSSVRFMALNKINVVKICTF